MGLLHHFSGDLGPAAEQASCASSSATLARCGREPAPAPSPRRSQQNVGRVAGFVPAPRTCSARTVTECGSTVGWLRSRTRHEPSSPFRSAQLRRQPAGVESAPSSRRDRRGDERTARPRLETGRLSPFACAEQPICETFTLRLDGVADVASSDAEQGTALLFEASRQLESFGVKLYATQPVVEWAEATAPQQEVTGELVRSSLAMFQGRR
ncbi:MAG: hypothetical protein JWR57_1499 [Mycetocola sp.]|nr:hypothetical protein [Mycetocola sp.]